jgi:hypothetical protein
MFRLRTVLPASAAALLCTGWASAAEAPVSAPRPDPADSAASVPRVNYSSAFAGYRKADDDTAADWKASNELARQIGGWRNYARMALEPAAAASGAAASPPAAHPHAQGKP